MTFYFKPEHFKTSLTVAVTSMLVMYTLNQSISAGLPETSYVKFIDVWLLFGLILPFFIIIMLVLIENFPQNKIEDYPENKKEESIVVFARIFAKSILPLVEISFVIVYVSIALIFYFE